MGATQALLATKMARVVFRMGEKFEVTLPTRWPISFMPPRERGVICFSVDKTRFLNGRGRVLAQVRKALNSTALAGVSRGD